jgi:ribonuclease Z
MFEIVFLGTSASAPSAHRGLASQVVMVKDQRFMIDCGEGTQRQILKSGIGFKKLNKILITHGHLDHILGLAGLMSSMIRWETLDGFDIYGGRWALERIGDLISRIVLRDEVPPVPVNLNELAPGLFYEDKDFTISAFPVTHRGSGCFGFIFQEKSRRPFLVEKAEALGIPNGPERALLVRGNAVALPDGRVIEPEDVLGPDLPGARYVHIGDVGRTDNILEYVRDAHALVIEATYLEDEREMALAHGHLTAAMAAKLAQEANVQTLILTHISRRNRERDVIAEAQAIHPNTFVARDFDKFVVAKGKPVEKVIEPQESRA